MHINSKKIKIGILGYGNLGKGLALAVKQSPDMELVGIFTRRDPKQIAADYPVYSTDNILDFQEKIEVLVLCGGSLQDLPEQIIEMAPYFHTVDSFDTHAKIPEYFAKVEAINNKHKTLSLISTGWDPGLFSLMRVLGKAVLPEGDSFTFWGKGLSQGHSDALRKVRGVKNGVQYTIPKPSALEAVRNGNKVIFDASDMHDRICYVVAENGADKAEIERNIKSMPHYFQPYTTTVYFISEEELEADHQAMPHGGTVIRTGKSALGEQQRLEFSLALESNPNFTASVLLAYARAIGKMGREGLHGTKTIFDIPIGYLSIHSPEILRKEYL